MVFHDLGFGPENLNFCYILTFFCLFLSSPNTVPAELKKFLDKSLVNDIEALPEASAKRHQIRAYLASLLAGKADEIRVDDVALRIREIVSVFQKKG